MPELPEAETIARDLRAALPGAVVREVEVVRRDVLRGITSPTFARRLAGARLVEVSRRAKRVVLNFGEAGRLVVSPGFTGAMLIDGAPDDRYTCVRFALADGRVLRYHDVRRLGRLQLLSEKAFAAWSAAIGPEPLDPALTAERFAAVFRGSARAAKVLLMDQSRLAGVGNIYANEALWMARVRPARAGRRVTRAESDALLAAVREVLAGAIERRGTTLRDYRDPYGGSGGFGRQLEAYGRGGEPCSRCGGVLKASHAIDRRQSVWCPRCQK